MARLIFVVMLVVSLSINASASDQKSSEQQTEVISKLLERLDASLDLTEDQKAAITTILRHDQQQRAELRQRQEGDRQAIRTAMQEQNALTRTQIEKQLNDEQRNKYIEIHRRIEDQEPEMQLLAERLDLTDGQIEQIAPILAETSEKVESLRSKSRSRQLRDEMRQLMDTKNQKITAILDKEQQEEFQKLIEERQSEMQDRAGARRGRGRRR